MKLLFYTYDYQYKIKDQKVLIHLYSELADGRKPCIVIEHEHYFYAAAGQRNLTPENLQRIIVPLYNQQGKVTRWEEVEKEFQGKRQKFLKIYTNVPMAVPPISKELEALGVSCYEKDILFVQRFIRDTGILPLVMAEAEGDFVKVEDNWLRVPLFLATRVAAMPTGDERLGDERPGDNKALPHSLDELDILSFDIAPTRPLNTMYSGFPSSILPASMT